MKAYQQRVVKEHDKLSARLVKINAFNASEAFTDLPLHESSLLTQQAMYMGYYLGVLSQRIRLWA